MKINELMETRVSSMRAERTRLVESWSPIVNAAEAYLQKEGRELSDIDKQNISRCCENALLDASKGSRGKLFETTDSSNIQFLGIQLPVIAALLPSLALNELATIQALDRRTAGVFYFDVKYGTTKGSVTAADTMIAATTGHNATIGGRRYASQRVENELVEPAGEITAAGILAYLPVIAGSVTMTDGVETWTDDGAGVMNSDLSTSSAGTIDYATGAYVLHFTAATISPTYADYKYNYETKTTNGVPEVNFEITESTLTAEDFPLRANYTLAAAIDLERAHGISLEDELVKYLGNEVKFTMDHLGIDLMNTAASATGAATSPGTFSATISSGQEWIWHKYRFIDFVEKANVNIIAKTLRMLCTWIVVGNDASRLIRQLDPHFKAAANLNTNPPTGPYVLGTLDGRTVVHDPFLDSDRILFGWKGDSYLQAAFVFAPYIPLLTTPTLVTADLKAQKGFLSSGAYKVINNGALCYGAISGLQ